MVGKSDWRLTLECINKKTGEFTPFEIREEVNNCSTINNYVNYLRKYGYIERVGHGRYIKVEDIPTNLSITRIIKLVYHPLFERIKKLRKIKNRISENNI